MKTSKLKKLEQSVLELQEKAVVAASVKKIPIPKKKLSNDVKDRNFFNRVANLKHDRISSPTNVVVENKKAGGGLKYTNKQLKAGIPGRNNNF
jgi:hypothetical protein